MVLERIQLVVELVDKVTRDAKKVQQNFEKLNKTQQTAFNAMFKESQRFKAELLSVMFLGMAITRTIGNLFTEAFKTFNKITEGSTMSNNALTRLNAGMEFFKFLLAESLVNSGLFQAITVKVIELIDWFSNLSDRTRGWIVIALGATFIFGAIATIIGIVGLGLSGVIQTTQLFFGRMVLVNGQWLKMPGLMTPVINGLKTITLWLLANPIVLWITSFLALASVFVLLMEKFGGFTNALKVMAAAIVLFITLVVEGVVNTIFNTINMALKGIAMLLRLAARAASAAGFDDTADKLRSAAEEIQRASNFRVNFTSPVAQLLDNIGFNPQPVTSRVGSTPTTSIVQNNEFNVQGITDPRILTDEVQNQLNEDLERLGLST